MPVNRLLCGSLDHSSDRVRERYGANIIKTRDLIRKQLPSVKEEREALQKAGEKLDRADGGAWVKNALVRFIEDKCPRINSEWMRSGVKCRYDPWAFVSGAS